jgi:ankyrin repeat protein
MLLTKLIKKLLKECKIEDEAEVLHMICHGTEKVCRAHENQPFGVYGYARRIDRVKTIINSLADVNCTDSYSFRTVASSAAEEGMFNIVMFMAFKGADFSTPDYEERTTLHYAVRTSTIEQFSDMLAFDADIEKKDYNENTVLHEAVSYMRGEHINLLISLGSDPLQKNRFGHAYLDKSNWDRSELRRAYESKTVQQRIDERNSTMKDIKHKLGIRLMEFAQPEILDTCIAMAPLTLPAYVMLWILDELPNYHRVSHIRKIRLIENVIKSISNCVAEKTFFYNLLSIPFMWN